MSNFTNFLKRRLVDLGPSNVLTRTALKLYVAGRGLTLRFRNSRIEVSRGKTAIYLAASQANLVPFLVGQYDYYFSVVRSESIGGVEILDFSRRRIYTVADSGLEFETPSIPEDDVNGYFRWYRPQSGDLVFDVGAHAGISAFTFSKLVGPQGRVIAFEPDDENYSCLVANIKRHSMSNVTPVKKAIGDRNGVALFNMEGTMGSGLVASSPYPNTGRKCEVEVMTLAEAGSVFGIPSFVKMDIEGGEVASLLAAELWLRSHRIYFGVDTNHPMGGSFTDKLVENAFAASGYQAESAWHHGALFTWARP